MRLFKTIAVFIVIMQVTLLVADESPLRHRVLWQYSYSNNFYHGSSSSTDSYIYSHTESHYPIPSSFSRHSVVTFDGHITHDDTFAYQIEHYTTALGNDTKYEIICSQPDNGNVSYHKIFILDPQENTKYYYLQNINGSNYTVYRMINPVTGLVDSVFFRYGRAFKKFIYDFDTLNRVSESHLYTSSDSLNWAWDRDYTYTYGELLPVTLKLGLPETLTYELVTYFPDAEYRITQVHEQHSTYAFDYSYINYGNPLQFYIGEGPSPNFLFNTEGCLAHYGEYGTGNDSWSWNYHWGVIVPNEDEVSPDVSLICYPNPFRIRTTLRYDLDKSAKVAVEVFNIKGQKLKSLCQSDQNRGTHTLSWDGTDVNGKSVTAGVYLLRLQTDSKVTNHKIVKKH